MEFKHPSRKRIVLNEVNTGLDGNRITDQPKEECNRRISLTDNGKTERPFNLTSYATQLTGIKVRKTPQVLDENELKLYEYFVTRREEVLDLRENEYVTSNYKRDMIREARVLLDLNPSVKHWCNVIDFALNHDFLKKHSLRTLKSLEKINQTYHLEIKKSIQVERSELIIEGKVRLGIYEDPNRLPNQALNKFFDLYGLKQQYIIQYKLDGHGLRLESNAWDDDRTWQDRAHTPGSGRERVESFIARGLL